MRTNEKLWEQVKKEIQGSKKWNARIAQQAVQEYKRRGGGYTDEKKKNSLSKWTKEDWGYVKGSKRYLPKKTRDIVEKSPELKKKVTRGKKLGKKKEYPEELKKIMRKQGIF